MKNNVTEHAGTCVLDAGCHGTQRRRVLLIAYYCSPSRGSDWSTGWGRAIETAKLYDTTVITSELSRGDLEEHASKYGPMPGLNFIYVGSAARKGLMDRITGSFLYTNWFSYRAWHRDAFRVAQEHHRDCRFDLVHQVNLIGFREPGDLWQLDAPFLWGPIGGFQCYPWRFIPSAGLLDGIREAARTVANHLQLRFSTRVRRALERSSVVLAANTEAQNALRSVHKIDPVLLLETGLWQVAKKPRTPDPTRPIRILWSGELIPRKAIHILLRAAAALPPDCPFEIRVLGKGPAECKARSLCNQLGISDRCTWLGWQPLSTAMQQYDWADIFAFTSLRDTSGNVVLEALSRGVPVICFDHQGARDMVTRECGVKIPVTSPSEAIRLFRDAIQNLSENRSLLGRLSTGALKRAQHYLWQRNGEVVSDLYASVLAGSRKTAAQVGS